MRAKPWAGGLSVQQLRDRAKQEPWAKALKDQTWRNPRYGARCALYYLISGDESAIPGLVANILAGRPQWNCGGGLVALCQQYDYICHSPTVTEDQRRQMRDHLVDLAHASAKAQESWDVKDLWHHRGAGRWASDVLVAGLTLAGEHPEGRKLLAWGAGHFQRNYLPDKTRVETTGFDYAPHHLFPGATYIFHKGRLAIQSGLYEAYRGNHWDPYYRLSASSNTMLVQQPGEFLWSVHGTDIAIGDTKLTAPPPCELIAADGNTMAGLSAGGWVVLFGRSSRVDLPKNGAR